MWKDGTLEIFNELDSEQFAMDRWLEMFRDGKVSLRLEKRDSGFGAYPQETLLCEFRCIDGQLHINDFTPYNESL